MGKTAYELSGVDYGAMDPFKVKSQRAGVTTARFLREHGYREVPWSRGESCYLIEHTDRYFGFVTEGLGTKNLVVPETDPIFQAADGYPAIGQDNFAMIVNDMAPLGVQPLVIGMFMAAGSGDWFKNEMASGGIVEGSLNAAKISRATWGCGETQTVIGNVTPEGLVLAGGSFGHIYPKKRLMSPFKIRAGDDIVLFASNGIHANGLTLARKIAKYLPNGYQTHISYGDHGFRRYGEDLLQPTVLYSPIIQDCLREGIPLHYGVHITGHGWAKLLRSPKPLTYVIERIPEVPELFKLIQDMSPEVSLERKRMSDKEMYKTFNMGAGFAVYVAHRWTQQVIDIADKHNVPAFLAGYVTKSQGNERYVYIRPKDITFNSEDLKVR